MEAQREMKPNRKAFVYWHFATQAIASLIILTIAFFVFNIFLPGSWLYIAVFYVLINAVWFYSLTVRYRKEKYLFFPGKIIAKGGGIFHDRQTELVIRNITHVTLVRPWLEFKFFGTGRILVELAGSARAEAVITSVDNPQKVYEDVIRIMRANGFRLVSKKLIQKERPALLGVFFETIGRLVGTLLGIIIFGIYMFGSIFEFLANALGTGGLLGLIGLIVLGVLAFSALNFLNLMKRTYYIYDDTIVYSEGFLTKFDSFIPIENLADSEITQTLIDKILGLYDVKISCQGAAQEILFKNLRNGSLMEKNVDALINQTESLVGTGKKEVSKEAVGTKLVPGKTLPMTVEKAYQAGFKMEMGRSLAPAADIQAGITIQLC